MNGACMKTDVTARLKATSPAILEYGFAIHQGDATVIHNWVFRQLETIPAT